MLVVFVVFWTPYYTVLDYNVLYCTIQYCTLLSLYNIVLYCTVLYCTVQVVFLVAVFVACWTPYALMGIAGILGFSEVTVELLECIRI